jgi:hypothetical protein
MPSFSPVIPAESSRGEDGDTANGARKGSWKGKGPGAGTQRVDPGHGAGTQRVVPDPPGPVSPADRPARRRPRPDRPHPPDRRPPGGRGRRGRQQRRDGSLEDREACGRDRRGLRSKRMPASAISPETGRRGQDTQQAKQGATSPRTERFPISAGEGPEPENGIRDGKPAREGCQGETGPRPQTALSYFRGCPTAKNAHPRNFF